MGGSDHCSFFSDVVGTLDVFTESNEDVKPADVEL